jgi:hypothetical protein
MPHYYFDIKDGHRLVDASGLDFKNDDAAIAKAGLELWPSSSSRDGGGARTLRS